VERRALSKIAGKFRTANGIIDISKILEAAICGLPVNPFCARFIWNSVDRFLSVERSADLFPLIEARAFTVPLYPRSSAYAGGLWI
jgi:hypothetical protein